MPVLSASRPGLIHPFTGMSPTQFASWCAWSPAVLLALGDTHGLHVTGADLGLEDAGRTVDSGFPGRDTARDCGRACQHHAAGHGTPEPYHHAADLHTRRPGLERRRALRFRGLR